VLFVTKESETDGQTDEQTDRQTEDKDNDGTDQRHVKRSVVGIIIKVTLLLDGRQVACLSVEGRPPAYTIHRHTFIAFVTLTLTR